MATGSENLDIVIRARGGRQAAAEARMVERAFAQVGRTTGSTRVIVDSAERSAVRASGGFGMLAGSVGALTAGFGALKVLTTGLNFNAQIETSRVNMEFFLKSTEGAKEQMAELIKLGRQMPALGQAGFLKGGQQLLAFGAQAKSVTPWLQGIGAAVNMTGTGEEGLQAVIRNFGQILSTGKVMGDELQELASWGIPAAKILRESGVAKPGKDIGAQNIPAQLAIDTITERLRKDYLPLVEKSNKTWAVQTAAVKQYAREAAGALVKPFQDWLQSGALDDVAKKLQGIAAWLKAGGAEKLWTGISLAVQAFGPLIALMVAYRTAVLAAAAAQWLMNAAMTANPIGIIIVGIGLLIGIVILLVKHWDKVKAAFVAVWDWISDHPWVAIFAGPLGAMVVLATQVVKHWDKIKAVILKVWDAISPIVGKMIDFLKFAVKWSPAGMIGKGLGIDIPFMAGGGMIPVGGAAIVGEAGPELARNRGGGTEIVPLGGGSAGQLTALHVHTMIDSREIAESVFNVGFTAAARA